MACKTWQGLGGGIDLQSRYSCLLTLQSPQPKLAKSLALISPSVPTHPWPLPTNVPAAEILDHHILSKGGGWA